ncbi:hypothetical protein BDD12DRAFT_878701 [Trichophaea hybrida]|nr:hypothetical protein BDD12DRAFT_878701 [Trichophaea hybrida]
MNQAQKAKPAHLKMPTHKKPIHQDIHGRYITYTVLKEYLKRRWPTTPTDIDNEDGFWRLKIPERISEKEIMQLQDDTHAKAKAGK